MSLLNSSLSQMYMDNSPVPVSTVICICLSGFFISMLTRRNYFTSLNDVRENSITCFYGYNTSFSKVYQCNYTDKLHLMYCSWISSVVNIEMKNIFCI